MTRRMLCEIVGDAEHEDAGEVEVTVKVKTVKPAPVKPEVTAKPPKVQEDKEGRQLLLE